jgi:rieske iron-sulfur protein
MHADCGHHRCVSRRTVIGAGLALAPTLAGPARADDPAAIPPQVGDRFAFLAGDRRGKIVKLDDLTANAPQVQAYPIDAATGVLRDSSRFNLVLLVRLRPEELGLEIRDRAADGALAFSGVCTHQSCPVNQWSSDRHVMVCSCHGSMFDPRAGAQVVFGPAPRPLPSLGLKIENGSPVVAAPFNARVGGMRT